MPLTLLRNTQWVLGFEEIGIANNYSSEEIKMYGMFIKMCEAKFKGGE